MGHLDTYFQATATRDVDVYPTPVPGESTIEPGYVYPVEGSTASAIFGIAAHPVAEVIGRRIALKVITDVSAPTAAVPAPAPASAGGPMSITAPDGQVIEGDDGLFSSHVYVGYQTLGAYREWLCDGDGAWLMVGRVGGEVGTLTPAGQIVIRGTPITIRGTPLVNTVPPAAPPPLPMLPVTVAKPAVIVPRASALVPAVRGPVVRVPHAAGDTIELEDAFADASLEMDDAGEKFRVAETLQAVVVSTRFAFTLRTTSVYATSFEEIGVMRIDGVALSGVATFIAELEVAVPEQTVEVQLYDLTAAAVVATLTATSLVTVKQSTLVALPLAEHLYSVRLRRVGGTPSDRVSCRSAYFEV